MRKPLSYILSLTLVLATALSCEKFLDEQPTNAVNTDTAIATTSDAEVVLNGIMRLMSSKEYYGRNFMMYADIRGGDLTIMSTGRGLDYLYSFNQSPVKASGSEFWTKGYSCIMNINNLIENIERMDDDVDGDFTQYLGSAYALRAYVYFDLVRLYGLPYNYDKGSLGVPLVLETLSASSKPERATVGEVYGQILSDLSKATALLDKTPLNGYCGYYAAKAEEARVRLYMDDWSGALSAAREIIDSGEYSLYEPSKWVRSWSEQFGDESIFEIGIDAASDIETESLGFYYIAYGRVSNAAGWFLASDYFLDRLGQDPDDVRWGVMDLDEFATTQGIDHYGACYKYVGGLDFEGDGKETYTAVNVKAVRLSEMYLIASEAALECGNASLAAQYLNAIRRRSPSLEPATSSTIDIDMILDERSKELFGEGHRAFDMLRRNRTIEFNDDLAGIAVTQRGKTVDRTSGLTVMPIDQDEMNANPNLVQNPAYR